MAKINGLDKMSYADLVDLQKRVEAAIADRKAAEAQDLKHKLEQLAVESGFSVVELFGGNKRGPKKGSVVAVKYRNPKDPSQTWTGRGRKPNWLVEALSKGAKIEKFAA